MTVLSGVNQTSSIQLWTTRDIPIGWCKSKRYAAGNIYPLGGNLPGKFKIELVATYRVLGNNILPENINYDAQF